MAKTLTLYPAYFKKQDSSSDGEDNFYRILSSNGTGEAAHKAANNSTVGVIAFDMSPLRGLSTACQITGYGLSYQQRCNINVWAKQYWINSPLKLTNVSITGQTLNSFTEASYGSGFRTDTTGNDYLNKSGSFFSTTQDGSGLFESGSAYLAFRLGWHNDQGGQYKTWMRNLRATVTYTPRYNAKFYDEDGTLADTQTLDSGETPTPPSSLNKTGYKIAWWKCVEGPYEGDSYEYPTYGTDKDMGWQPVYEPLKMTVTTYPYPNVYVEKQIDGNWEVIEPASVNSTKAARYSVTYNDRVRYKVSGYRVDQDVIVDMQTSQGYSTIELDFSDQSAKVAQTEYVTKNSQVGVNHVTDVTYHVIGTAGTGGSITPTHQVSRHSNDSVLIQPSTGYLIDTVTVDDVAVTVTETGMTVVLEDISDDAEIAATFKKIMIPITFDVAEGITVTGPSSVGYGDDATWTFEVGSSSSLTSVSVDSGENLLGTVFKQVVEYEHTLETVVESHTIHASLSSDLATVTINQSTGGTITCDLVETSAKFVKDVGSLTFVATPDDYYGLDKWYDNSEADFITVQITADLTVSATWEAATIEIATSLTCEEELRFIFEKKVDGQWTPATKYCNVGDEIRISLAKPDRPPFAPNTVVQWANWGYEYPTFVAESTPLGGETVTKSGQDSVSITIVGETSVSATVARQVFYIGPNNTRPERGYFERSVQPDGNNRYTAETEVSVTAIPNPGFYFLCWAKGSAESAVDKSKGFSQTPTLKFVVPFHYESGKLVYSDVYAHFRPIQYTINASTSEGGSVVGGGTFYYNDKCDFVITADYGYRIKDVLKNGVSVYEAVTTTRRGGTLSITVTESFDLEVIFEKRMYQSHRLLDYYPPVIASIREIEKLMEVLQVTDDALWDSASFLMENQFIDTASAEGVTMWEKELGIVPSPSDTLAQRKARLRLKWVPNNRFTMKWLHKWLEDVCGTSIKTPVVHEKGDYILTVFLPWFVQWVEVFRDLEKYKPANIELDPTVTLPSKDINLLTGFALRTHTSYTVNGSDD